MDLVATDRAAVATTAASSAKPPHATIASEEPIPTMTAISTEAAITPIGTVIKGKIVEHAIPAIPASATVAAIATASAVGAVSTVPARSGVASGPTRAADPTAQSNAFCVRS